MHHRFCYNVYHPVFEISSQLFFIMEEFEILCLAELASAANISHFRGWLFCSNICLPLGLIKIVPHLFLITFSIAFGRQEEPGILKRGPNFRILVPIPKLPEKQKFQ